MSAELLPHWFLYALNYKKMWLFSLKDIIFNQPYNIDWRKSKNFNLETKVN